MRTVHLLLCLTLVYQQIAIDDAVDIILKASKSLNVQVVSTWGNLMSNVATTGTYGDKHVSINNYITFVNSWKTHEEFKQSTLDTIHDLLLSASGEFSERIITFNTRAGTGEMTTIIVAAKRDNINKTNPIELAYINMHAACSVITQYNTIPTHTCHFCWFHTCCHDGSKKVARGDTATEINIMISKLKNSQYQFVQQHIHTLYKNTLKSESFSLTIYENNNKNQIREIIEKHMNNISNNNILNENILKKLFIKQLNTHQLYVDTNNKVIKNVYNTINQIKEDTKIETLRQIDKNNMPLLLNAIMKRMNIKDKLEKQQDDLLNKQYNQIEILYNNNNVTNYLLLITLKNNKNSFNVQLTTTNAKIEIAPIINITRLSNEMNNNTLNKDPAINLNKSDINKLLNIFKQESIYYLLKKLSEQNKVIYINDNIIQKELSKFAFSIGQLTSAVKEFTSMWQSIVSAFKTITHVSVKQIIQHGFATYHEVSKAEVLHEFDNNHIQELADSMIKRQNMPDDSNLDDYIIDLSYAKDAAWEANNFIYNAKNHNKGDNKALQIYKSSNNKSDTSNWFIVWFDAIFSLAPDLLMITTDKSQLGGIFQTEKVDFKETPHYVTTEEVIQIKNFFKIVAFGKLAELMGVDYKWPELPKLTEYYE